ncbi:hypothetical protein G3M80_03425 [Bacillus altitudinis]|uniref:hypothetical protein n=1 Tax=Bacillus altitudinis TaxID=293387 RepID=UPI0013EEDED4|nr:hypothetical protein [Bacillus altitudinis]QII23664.1 hypothetical protein G3M80_03425 [Bacillus altitudinis]
MILNFANGLQFASELREIEKKARIAWESIWLEATDQMRSTRAEELFGTLSVQKKIEMDGKEYILEADFEVLLPETRDGETYIDVLYTGFELQN